MVNATPLLLYPWRRDLVAIKQEAGWAPEPVWTGAENLASTGIRFQDRQARSESLSCPFYKTEVAVVVVAVVVVVVITVVVVVVVVVVAVTE